MTRPSRRVLAVSQASYYLPTAVIPFVSRRAFERMTGEKREWWLVLTVASLVGAVAVSLAAAARRGDPGPETVALGAGTAVGMGLIDVVYVARRRISPVYLVDAAIQLPTAAAWLLSTSAD